jgi:hypothetical protein
MGHLGHRTEVTDRRPPGTGTVAGTRTSGMGDQGFALCPGRGRARTGTIKAVSRVKGSIIGDHG